MAEVKTQIEIGSDHKECAGPSEISAADPPTGARRHTHQQAEGRRSWHFAESKSLCKEAKFHVCYQVGRETAKGKADGLRTLGKPRPKSTSAIILRLPGYS